MPKRRRTDNTFAGLSREQIVQSNATVAHFTGQRNTRWTVDRTALASKERRKGDADQAVSESAGQQTDNGSASAANMADDQNGRHVDVPELAEREGATSAVSEGSAHIVAYESPFSAESSSLQPSHGAGSTDVNPPTHHYPPGLPSPADSEDVIVLSDHHDNTMNPPSSWSGQGPQRGRQQAPPVAPTTNTAAPGYPQNQQQRYAQQARAAHPQQFVQTPQANHQHSRASSIASSSRGFAQSGYGAPYFPPPSYQQQMAQAPRSASNSRASSHASNLQTGAGNDNNLPYPPPPPTPAMQQLQLAQASSSMDARASSSRTPILTNSQNYAQNAISQNQPAHAAVANPLSANALLPHVDAFLHSLRHRAGANPNLDFDTGRVALLRDALVCPEMDWILLAISQIQALRQWPNMLPDIIRRLRQECLTWLDDLLAPNEDISPQILQWLASFPVDIK